LATEAARLGSAGSDSTLLGDAEVAAKGAVRLSEGLPGHPLWRAQAESALSLVELARGHQDAALSLARGALAARNRAMREDPHLEVLLPAGRVLTELGSDEERSTVRQELGNILGMVAQRVQDEQVRVHWFRGPLGRRDRGHRRGRRTGDGHGQCVTGRCGARSAAAADPPGDDGRSHRS